jgi:DNA-binding transcriptional LysR family regulator
MSAAGGARDGTPRRRAFIAALTALVLAAGARHGPSARAQTRSSDPTLPDADWSAIRRTIDDQRKALKSGDARKAFSFAAPGIRAQFGTAETFLAMVRNGYGALIAARYVEFLEGAVIDGAVIQPLRLVAPDNSVLVALYTMEKQKDGRWRIAGCVLAPSTVQAA